MEYTIVSASGGELNEVRIQVQESVNNLIKQGWKPQGGLSLMYNSNAPRDESKNLMQAMVKE